MYIGKVLKALVLAVSVFAAGVLWLPGVSLAADVWCCSHDGRTFYLDSDSINAANLPKGMDYRVSVKAVRESDGSLERTVIYGFESQNDRMVAGPMALPFRCRRITYNFSRHIKIVPKKHSSNRKSFTTA